MDRERVLERQAVIVRDGRIAEIGPARKVKAPDGALRVDGTGKYLMRLRISCSSISPTA
jgi:imidazolonepropionase-like amidohydrolase